MTTPLDPQHRFSFYRVGGLDQVVLRDARDLRHLERLDQKLWVALSCPVKGLELDQRTLELLDTDHDGRVRAPEVLAAISWCGERLSDLGSLLPGLPALPLTALDAGTPAGKALRGAARQLLVSLGKPDAVEVTIEDVKDLTHVFEKTLFNGDGVVPPEAAGDDATRQLIADAIACAGAVTDRSGKPGIDQAKLDAFFAELGAFAAWQEAGAAHGVMAYGPGTPAAHEAVEAVRAKVDDHFARCRLAAMDPRGAALLNRSDADLIALAARPLSAGSAELAAFPIARVEAGRPLPLDVGVNPAWADQLAALARSAVAAAWGPGRPTLAADEWSALLGALAPYQAWLAQKKGATVEKLGAARVKAVLATGKGPVEALLAQDRAQAPEADAVVDVARLVHYHRDLYRLLNNFVSFADFYDSSRSAVFQAGTLYLDGRSCDLCVKVDDPGAHAGLAALSRMYLAYCECRRASGEKMKIAACFTQGDSSFLMVGRNGIFYDRQGRDWDAVIVKLVENPVSIRQAFFAPYRWFLKAIEDSVASFAAAKEKESAAKLEAAAHTTTGAATGAVPAAKAEAFDIGKMVGIIAALGVGAGALGTVLGGMVSGFVGLQPWWAKLVALAGAVLVISGPAMLTAWLKLRQRNLGPVLDANGWAINGRVKVGLPLGAALTDLAALPPGATRSLEDPFEDHAARARRRVTLLLVIAVAAVLGWARYTGHWPFGPWPW